MVKRVVVDGLEDVVVGLGEDGFAVPGAGCSWWDGLSGRVALAVVVDEGVCTPNLEQFFRKKDSTYGRHGRFGRGGQEEEVVGSDKVGCGQEPLHVFAHGTGCRSVDEVLYFVEEEEKDGCIGGQYSVADGAVDEEEDSVVGGEGGEQRRMCIFCGPVVDFLCVVFWMVAEEDGLEGGVSVVGDGILELFCEGDGRYDDDDGFCLARGVLGSVDVVEDGDGHEGFA